MPTGSTIRSVPFTKTWTLAPSSIELVSVAGNKMPSRSAGRSASLVTSYSSFAKWGYDSYTEQYVFGYKLHLLTTTHDHQDLPLHVSVDTANAPEVVTAPADVVRLVKLLRAHLPKARVRLMIPDRAYDAGPLYSFLRRLHIQAVIPMREDSYAPADANECPRASLCEPNRK